MATGQAWKTLAYYESCLGLDLTPDVQTNTSDNTIFQAELRRLHRTVARRLFTARRTIFSEGLGEAFDEVTKRLHIEHIWSDAEEANVYGHRTLEKQLAMCQPLSLEEGQQDKLTRLNEWLLETFIAVSWHLELYRSLYRPCPPYDRFFTPIKDRLNSLKMHILEFEYHGDLLRQCIKFWFLDSASMLQEAVTPSTIATSDSDATFRPTEENETIPSSVELASEHPTDEASYGRNFTPQSNLLWHTGNPSWTDEGVGLPPDNVDQEDLARAGTALEEYQKEENHISQVKSSLWLGRARFSRVGV